jgi:flagellar motor switch protein FliN/FliY
MTTDQTLDRDPQSFSIAFFSALAGAMSKACGSPWQIAAVPDAGSTPDGAEPVRMKFTLDGSLRGELLVEFRGSEVLMLASKLLGHAADEYGEEEADALQRLSDAVASDFSSALEQQYGTFKMKASPASEPLPDSMNVVQINEANDDASGISVAMSLNPALKEALLVYEQAGNSGLEAGPGINADAGMGIPDAGNLDLVMDVDLNVTLRFGKRQLTLREVMDLTTGSVVELDRQVEEPVELLLNGMVIARGEAVVIDGNYGLRVTEVSQHVSSLALG